MAESVTITAFDGYPLAATRYSSSASACGHLIVAGATGVEQRFYRRFAEHAAARGFLTLTLDYRGIGRSRPASLRGFGMSYLDWGRLDLAAAVEEMKSEQLPLYMVGHSYGGHAFGMLPNHEHVSRFYTFGTGAGWHGWMPPLERLRVQLMWQVVMPPLTWWKGYLPWSMLGLGEDLPLGVYREWKRWCRHPGYLLDEPSMSYLVDLFARVRAPIAAANSRDDLWAQPRSRDAFMKAYRNATIERIDINPRDAAGSIGHMGYFREHARPLWDRALDWLAQDSGPGFQAPVWTDDGGALPQA
jgi:predicted alpha/beta hydrolase